MVGSWLDGWRLMMMMMMVMVMMMVMLSAAG
jgi:hypothetical protein